MRYNIELMKLSDNNSQQCNEGTNITDNVNLPVLI